VIVFPGGFNWPIWAAQEKGFFTRNGVDVKITLTPNSVFQLTGLIEGRFDIAMTAIDNLVAYREGQGEAQIEGPDLVAVMGGDNGFLRLVAVPDVKTIGELRGRTVSVDARTTGYAFVLFELLDRGGLREPAYKVERAGGVLQRYQTLLEKKFDATLLISPFEVQAEARGFNRLANASATLGNYQGLVAGVRQGWAQQNQRAVVGYIRGFVAGVEWLYDPANREEALAILMKNVPTMNRQGAETAYRVLLDPKDGFTRRARIDMEGVRTVLQLRTKWSTAKKPLADPAKYYDGRFYDEAMQR
jgi:ABC-type nitrate/sulfonate/bicarbonate transport system substrate-binding protein